MPDKLKMETADITKQNIERIAELFPNAITEIIDEKGNIKKGINFELLKQELSDEVIEGDEAYEFSWVGKKAAIIEANKPIRKTLRPCVEESKNWESTENLYIEGDNLDVLKLLQESYLNSIKMIYIDPPYNTGKDRIYKDNFTMNKEDYNEQIGIFDEEENRLFQNTETNGRFHSDWCSMIYPRLKLARNLLSDDGVIFISIDYNENFNLRTIMNEVFGASNFIGEIYWESKTKSQNTSTSYNKLQPKAEMILVYAKQSKRRFNLITKSNKDYPCSDEQGEYREYPIEVMNATGVRGRETMIYDITDGVSTVSPPAGKQWQLGQSQIATYKADGNLFIREGKVIIKMRPEFERVENTEPFWGFFTKEMGTAESAKKELTDILGQHGFETVKPIDVVKRLIFHATEKDNLILDFFSGSATAAHAVMQLNAEDGGKRKFIMVQIQEPTEENSEAYRAGYKNICEIGKERIRQSGEKIKNEMLSANGGADGQTAFITPEIPDIGFRVFKLDSTNMNEVYYSVNEYSQTLLTSLESNIKQDRSDIDLLYGCMLNWGLPLQLKHTNEEINGLKVHIVKNGTLIACFEKNITEKVIREIAKRQPEKAVFKDSGFASSPEKINVTEIFKLLAPNTSVKVI